MVKRRRRRRRHGCRQRRLCFLLSRSLARGRSRRQRRHIKYSAAPFRWLARSLARRPAIPSQDRSSYLHLSVPRRTASILLNFPRSASSHSAHLARPENKDGCQDTEAFRSLHARHRKLTCGGRLVGWSAPWQAHRSEANDVTPMASATPSPAPRPWVRPSVRPRPRAAERCLLHRAAALSVRIVPEREDKRVLSAPLARARPPIHRH